MSDAHMVRSAGKVSLAVMASRVFGLIRDQVFAWMFGCGALNDAFQVAFRIPNLLRDLFAEGALSTAFVTVLSKARARSGDAAAWRIARLTMTLQMAVLGGIVLLGILFTPWIVERLAKNYAAEPGKLDLTIRLTRVLFPFILFVAAAALAMGLLNAFGRFGLPASASIFFNLGSILVGLGLALLVDPAFGERAVFCMALGTLAGGALQWLIQVPAMRKEGYRFQWAWDPKDSGLRDILRLMAPAVIGVSATQVNVLINLTFATACGNGAVSALTFAFRIMQLPIGVFGVAIATAALPALAMDATTLDSRTFRERVERALRLNAAFCVPAACGLALLGTPLTGLLFERGRFDVEATLTTAQALSAYSLGLVGYASVKILGPVFYALNRPLVPMFVSLGSIVLTFSLNWFFAARLHAGPAGIALATALSALASASLLLSSLSRLVGPVSRRTWLAAFRILVAAAGMSVVVALADWALAERFVGHDFFGYLGRTLLGVALGAISYFWLATKLGVEEARELHRSVRRRLVRRTAR
ncbi:MAG: murein biosynthesis integral membrane protein MurJ [Verrucomicrobiae bacterium]|nr:murein biosynthesis integral membrane protein MurJ [Verrucomicrobiae bacterium]